MISSSFDVVLIGKRASSTPSSPSMLLTSAAFMYLRSVSVVMISPAP